MEIATKIYKGEKGAEQIIFAGGNAWGSSFMAIP